MSFFCYFHMDANHWNHAANDLSRMTKPALRRMERHITKITIKQLAIWKNEREKTEENIVIKKLMTSFTRKKRYKQKKYEEVRKKYEEANKEKIKEKDLKKKARNIKDLTNCYVASKMGMQVKDCSEFLINMKREQILLFRDIRLLNKTIKEIENEH